MTFYFHFHFSKHNFEFFKNSMSSSKKYYPSSKHHAKKYIEEEAEEDPYDVTSSDTDVDSDADTQVVTPSAHENHYYKWCKDNNADEMESNPEPKYENDLVRKILMDKEMIEMGNIPRVDPSGKGQYADYLPPHLNRWMVFIAHVEDMDLQKPKEDQEGYYAVRFSNVQVARFAGKDVDGSDWIKIKSSWLYDIAEYLKSSKHMEHSIEVVLNLYRILVWKNDNKHSLIGDDKVPHDWMDMKDEDVVVPVVALKYTIKNNICYVNLFLDGNIMLVPDDYVEEKVASQEDLTKYATPKRKRSRDYSLSPPVIKRTNIGALTLKKDHKKKSN